MKYVIGIDEVGRGPIAGPLVVCACAVDSSFDTLSLFPGRILKDSKKLTEKKREVIFSKLNTFIEDKSIIYGLGEVSAEEIDTIGLSQAIINAVKLALDAVHVQGVPRDIHIYLDGSLYAPEEYTQQETIIKGDEKIGEMALASIIAKVYRDNVMREVAKEYPLYGFENHVGYGTATHYEAITKHGLTPHHRKSFLKKNIH